MNTCPKCGSNNISYQREQSWSADYHRTNYGKRGHSIIWWLFIGWWWWMIKISLYLIAWPFMIFKKKGSANTFGASKTINHTVAVCQNCGNSWKM